MSRQPFWSSVLVIVCVCRVSAATHYVGTCGTPNFPTINAAIKVAAPGDTVKICPGYYPEQVIISKPLTLTGVSANNHGLVVISPASGVTTTSTVTGTLLAPLVWVTSGSVNISNVEVGGPFVSPCPTVTPTPLNVGFYYADGSSGSLNSVASNIYCGAGIWLENASDTGGAVTVQNSVVAADLYGIVAAGGPHVTGTIPLLRPTITGNQIDHYFQGINLYDVGGTVTGNGVDPLGMFGANLSVGISDVAPDALVTNNKIMHESTGIDVLVPGATVTSNRIQSDSDFTRSGIDLHCFLSNVSKNNLYIGEGPTGKNHPVGINNVPAGFTKTNFFHDTQQLTSRGSC